MVKEFAVDEAEATADLLGEAAINGMFKRHGVVGRFVTLVVAKA